MNKLNTFLIGIGIVAIIALLLKPLGLENVVAGIGALAVAYAVFYPPK